MRKPYIFIFMIVCAIIRPGHTHAAVAQFSDKSAWLAAAGPHTSIGFVGFPEHTLITTQYASLGVTFSDGNDRINFNDSHLNDGVGLKSSDPFVGIITMQFAQPVTAVACDFIGQMRIYLYEDGELVFESVLFSTTGGRFGGVISTTPFDMVEIRDPFDSVVVIDDLYFGPPIPAPGALGLLGLAAFGRRRRRSSS